jgi:GNAT superfamily N-acetyltransferase
MLTIRPAQPADVPSILTLIRELAQFEKLTVSNTEEILLRDGFGPEPRYRALIAEWDGQLAGYAFFFPFYSTFSGRGMFLEDLFVRSQYRGKKIGSALLARVAAIAVEENCVAMRWQVLDWNQPAIDFYTKLDAEFLDEWRTVSLSGEPLRRVAQNKDSE